MKSSAISQVYLAYFIGYIASIGNPLIVSNIPIILQEFDLTVMEAGLIISFYALPGIFFIPLSGVISDRIGRRPLVLGCFSISILGSILCYLAPTYSILLVGRFLQGMSLPPLEAVCNTLITDNFEGTERAGYLAKCTISQYVALATVPFIVSSLYSFGGWRISFAFSAFLGILGVYFCRSAQFKYSVSKGVSFQEYVTHLKYLLKSIYLLSFFAIRAIGAFIIFGALYGYYALYLADKFGYGSQESANFFVAYGVGMCVGAYFITYAYKRGIGQRWIAVLGGGQLIIAALCFIFASSPWHVALGITLVGTGQGVINATTVGHVSFSTTSDTRGTILSAYSTVFRTFQFIAPIVFGLIYNAMSFSGVYLWQFILSIFLLVIPFVIFPLATRVEHEQHTV